MNAKIPIKQLSEQVAAKVNIDAQDAQDAIKSIFALIADTLKDGKSVTLDDLGTFAPDVNPQEPIEFTTAPELADELNAPFAMFEPEIIADELSNAELSAAGSDEATAPQESATAVNPATSPLPQPPAESRESIPAQASAPRVGWAAARTATPTTPPVAPTATPVEAIEKPVELPKPEPAAAPVVTASTEEIPTPKPIEPKPEEPSMVTPPTPSVASEPPTQSAPKTTEESIATPPTAAAMPRPALEVPEWPEEEEIEEPYTPTETTRTEPSDGQGRFKTGFFWGLIVGLLIGALLLFGYAMYFSEAF